MPVSRNICLINFENRLGDFQSKCSGGRRFCNFKVNVPWRNTLFFPATLHGPCQKPGTNGLAGLTKSAKRPAGSRNVPTCIQIRILDIEEILALLTEKSSTLRKKDNT